MALSLLGATTSAVTPKPPGPSTGRSRRGMKTETERSTAPDSTVSPSLVNSSPESHAAAVAAAAAAAFSGLTHPLLSSSHAAAILRASAAASQTAALMGLQSLGLPTSLTGGGAAATGVPVHLHATLASGPALFQHGSLFNWSKLAQHTTTSNTPLPTRVTAARRQRKPPSNKRNNNNNKIKVESEVMSTHLDSSEPPLSPPTSGSSPPSTSGEPGNKAISSGGSSAGEPSKADGVGGRDKVFECRVCNRCFGYKHVLQNHERTHTGEKPFACPECNKRFTRDHHLKTHMRLHTGEKPYHCTHCERQFVQVANLRRHLRVHTGERPYACELCTSRFSDSNQLKAHMLIHKGEKPFACNLCGGRFRRRHHLMHHKCPEALREQNRHNKVRDLDELEEEEDELILDEEEMEVVAGDDGDVEDEDDVPSFIGAPSKKRERKAREIRRVIRAPSTGVSPLPSPPDEPRSTCLLPEQTEPEDLSMSTMLNNNNTILVSGNGLARRLQRLRQGSFSSSDDEEELHRRGKLLVPTPVSPAAFLAHRHPKFRRHITADAAAPPIS